MRILNVVLLSGLVAGTATPASAADTLGRLFMTPEQRQSLDTQREPGADVLGDATAMGATLTTPVEGQVLVNGLVHRSHGPDVVWINGVRASPASGEVRLQRGPNKATRVTLTDPTDGHSVRLKPGQYWERATGRVADCYGCGKPAELAPDQPPPAEPAADKP